MNGLICLYFNFSRVIIGLPIAISPPILPQRALTSSVPFPDKRGRYQHPLSFHSQARSRKVILGIASFEYGFDCNATSPFPSRQPLSCSNMP